MPITALLLSVGDVAVPPNSPANCILPVAIAVASGAPAAKLVVTNSVVANFVELSFAAWVTPVVPVGKLGVPVKVGEAIGAFKSTAACNAIPAVACWTKAVVASFVELSTAGCVTPIVPVGRTGVPVNVGDALSAFPSTAVCKAIPVVAKST